MFDLLVDHDFINLFWSKVDIGNPFEYWPWTGGISWDNYGRQNYPTSSRDPNRRHYHAHRLAYWISYGNVSDELVVDHMCHTTVENCGVPGVECPHRRCCNPFHLQELTRKENKIKSISGLCKRGHLLIEVGRNGAGCKLCFNEWQRNDQEKKRRATGIKEIGPYQKAAGLICSIYECEKSVRSKGLCNCHYLQSRNSNYY